jgi:hypothetical protein
LVLVFDKPLELLHRELHHVNVTRDLLWKEKRPTMEGKETYYGRKRDLI